MKIENKNEKSLLKGTLQSHVMVNIGCQLDRV